MRIFFLLLALSSSKAFSLSTYIIELPATSVAECTPMASVVANNLTSILNLDFLTADCKTFEDNKRFAAVLQAIDPNEHHFLFPTLTLSRQLKDGTYAYNETVRRLQYDKGMVSINFFNVTRSGPIKMYLPEKFQELSTCEARSAQVIGEKAVYESFTGRIFFAKCAAESNIYHLQVNFVLEDQTADSTKVMPFERTQDMFLSSFNQPAQFVSQIMYISKDDCEKASILLSKSFSDYYGEGLTYECKNQGDDYFLIVSNQKGYNDSNALLVGIEVESIQKFNNINVKVSIPVLKINSATGAIAEGEEPINKIFRVSEEVLMPTMEACKDHIPVTVKDNIEPKYPESKVLSSDCIGYLKNNVTYFKERHLIHTKE